jgi:sporulation protein YlmC with PRC-barrel domain
MRGRFAGDLLALPIRHQGIDLGRAVDVLLDLEAGRALGFEVHCPDDTRRFLPLGAARIGRGAVDIGSPLTLLDDLDFYRRRGSGLRALRGASVVRRGRPLGALDDLELSETGAVVAIVVRQGAGADVVPFGPDVVVDPDRKVSAA